jgi:V8-like Glu-specific endopeptidase
VREFYQKYRLAPGVKANGKETTLNGLEQIVRPDLPMVDWEVWWQNAAKVEPRVCRVEIQGKARGTGFLVGPEAVLTNYHVLKSVLDQPALASEVVLRFGYKKLADGTILSGTQFNLAGDWLIDSSPFSDAEAVGQPDGALPTAEQLDYALVRVKGEPGKQKVDRQPGEEAPLRGWIEVPDAAEFQADQPILIVQHPQGDPLKLALDTHSILAVNGNGTRVRHRTNTEPGSSGSPCFDLSWKLVALHHYGDPAYSHPAYNQGIPVGALHALLKARGKLDALGSA